MLSEGLLSEKGTKLDCRIEKCTYLKKTMFLSLKFANMRSTKALMDSIAVAESQPTPVRLLCGLSVVLPALSTVCLHSLSEQIAEL